MEFGNYAVVVDPEGWSGRPGELAVALARVTGHPAAALRSSLARGSLTIESELESDSAKRLCRRLEKMGIPARVESEEPTVGPTSGGGAPAAGSPAGDPDATEESFPFAALDESEEFDAFDIGDIEEFEDLVDIEELEGFDAEVAEEELSLASTGGGDDGGAGPAGDGEFQGGTESTEQSSGPSEWDAILGVGSSRGVGAAAGSEPVVEPEHFDDVRVERDTTELPEEASDGGGADAWGELFPELGEPPGEVAAASRTPEGRVSRRVPRLRPDDAPGEDESPREETLDFGAEPAPDVAASVSGESERHESPMESMDFGSEPLRSSGARGGMERGGTPGPEESADPGARNGFEADKFRGALLGGEEESERAPYEPEGYDPRAPHLPGLAALLSLIAPGAGQVYNGEEENAFRYGVSFPLIKPWIDSVRDAYERAGDVVDYQAPRPDEGVAGRVFRYVLVWYVVVAVLVIAIVAGVAQVEKMLDEPERGESRREIVSRAMDDALFGVRQARIAGIDELGRELDRRRAQHGSFTMSREERAERLFRIGYEFCTAHRYDDCEMMMRRVTRLMPQHLRAIRLQAWASSQRDRRGPDEPMPDIGAVETLTEYELRESGMTSGELERLEEARATQKERGARGVAGVDGGTVSNSDMGLDGADSGSAADARGVAPPQ